MTDKIMSLSARDGLPEALRNLHDDLPRDDWPGHANFAGLVQFWLERHGMFRQLLTAMEQDTEKRIDGTLEPQAHLKRLNRLGGMLVGELHGHHQIEDHHYFPQLRALDPRLSRGFDILDSDHHDLDGLLSRFTDSANGVLSGQSEPGPFHDQLVKFSVLLDRHLQDEEDLIVPVLLKHGITG